MQTCFVPCLPTKIQFTATASSKNQPSLKSIVASRLKFWHKSSRYKKESLLKMSLQMFSRKMN
jgi:hypothetical protein